MRSVTSRMEELISSEPDIPLNDILRRLWPGVERAERETWMVAVWYVRDRRALLRAEGSGGQVP